MSDNKPVQLSFDLSGVGGKSVDATLKRVRTLSNRIQRLEWKLDVMRGQYGRDLINYQAFKKEVDTTTTLDVWVRVNGDWYTRQYAKELVGRCDDFHYNERLAMEELRGLSKELNDAQEFLTVMSESKKEVE